MEERHKRKKKQIFEDLTELEGWGYGSLGPLNAIDISPILTDHQYLPRSSIIMRLLKICKDPILHFLPTKVTPNVTFFAGPPGIAPELQEMFMRPVSTFVPASKWQGTSPEKPQSKSVHIELEGEVSTMLEDEGEPGQGHCASVAPSQAESVGPVSGFALGSEWRTTRWTLAERTYCLWSSFATSLLCHRSSPVCHAQGEGRKRCLRHMMWGYKGLRGAGKCPRAGPGSVMWCMCTCRKSIENYTPVLGPHWPHHGSDLHPSRR